MKNYESIGVQIPNIVLPQKELDLQKWSVIACDQYTSQPDYWHTVEQIVGNSPSTLNLVLPEVFLEEDDIQDRIIKTQTNMKKYLEGDVFFEQEGFILVERTVSGKTRHGILLALDLEKYDFNKGSQTLIRATEGTIIERLPPRIRIREDAILEFPHILVLIDDPDKTVIEPLVTKKLLLRKLYDFELMMGSGHIRGFSIQDQILESQVIEALTQLANPDSFRKKYNIHDERGVLLFAMGDGNHSLATAKAIWEKQKDIVGLNHPSRYALVEIENVHDDGLEFEPIHRVVFNLRCDPFESMIDFWNNDIEIQKNLSKQEMIKIVDSNLGHSHKFGFIFKNSFSVIKIRNPKSNLMAGELQNFLDKWACIPNADKIDYVHGADVTCDLGNRDGNCGFYLPAMKKDDLFKTVILDGALPRKTFSMGEAKEKRFYLEGRRIK
ncbi:MAG: DUF1015 domain-containing protein [Anaerolineaceae bacterium]